MGKEKSEILTGNMDPPRTSFQCMDAMEISLCIEKEGLFFYESAGKKGRMWIHGMPMVYEFSP